MRAFIPLVLLMAGIHAGARAAPAEKKMLLIPFGPFAEQKLSDQMSARVRALNEEHAFSALDTWEHLADLPAWVFEPEKREIAYVFGRPLVMHDYRYAVIANKCGELLIVRTGGLGDSYEIFVRKNRPNPPTETAAAAVTPAASSSAKESAP